jgi:uncharacterized C2H2 Zn-finger protein
MRKLIEIHQDHMIVCDNSECDYKIINPTGDPNTDTREYLNMPCPKCGENLLTEKDYIQHLKVMKVINWMNKYLSWMTIFYSKKVKVYKASVHVHNRINISTQNQKH